MMESILAIAAHPDDVAYSIGGTLLLLKDDYKLHVICATKGEIGILGKTQEQAASIREKEEADASQRLGAELTFLGKIDGSLFAGREICEKVSEIISKIKPKAIFTLWPVDSHPDHSAISEITRKAMMLSESSAELYYFEAGMFTQTSQFAPDIYVDITDAMDEKMKLVRCHQSQNPEDRLACDCLKQSEIRGVAARCRYAEGFKTPHPIPAGRETIFSKDYFGTKAV